MTWTKPWLATTIGSLPHTSVSEACATVLRYTPEIPAWPQLPRRTPEENMYAQYMRAFPGVNIEQGKTRVVIDDRFQAELERLYSDYINGAIEKYLPDPTWAAGLTTVLDVLRADNHDIVFLKGQVIGPVSLALQVTDQDLKPLLYDDITFDAVAKYIKLVAQAQERALREVFPATMVFFDEPFLSAFGSALFAINRDQVIMGLEEAFSGIAGMKGVHCCGNTDWSIVLSTSLDILSFDAFQYSDTLALYPNEVKAFLDRGGILAWGIVPADEKLLAQQDTNSLLERLEASVRMLADKGISTDLLVSQSLLTPSCGLGSISVQAAYRALQLLAQISNELRSRSNFAS